MRPEVLVFFGLIASGKSTLAELTALELGWPWLNTDRVRKELAGLKPTERRMDAHGQGLYSPEMTQRTYQALLERGERILAAGRGVVLDGSYGRRSDRERVSAWSRAQGVAARFVLCRCSEEETRKRLARRARDPHAVSDGRWEIFLLQRQAFEPPDELRADRLLVLETNRGPKRLVGTIMEWLVQSGPGEEKTS